MTDGLYALHEERYREELSRWRAAQEQFARGGRDEHGDDSAPLQLRPLNITPSRSRRPAASDAGSVADSPGAREAQALQALVIERRELLAKQRVHSREVGARALTLLRELQREASPSAQGREAANVHASSDIGRHVNEHDSCRINRELQSTSTPQYALNCPGDATERADASVANASRTNALQPRHAAAVQSGAASAVVSGGSVRLETPATSAARTNERAGNGDSTRRVGSRDAVDEVDGSSFDHGVGNEISSGGVCHSDIDGDRCFAGGGDGLSGALGCFSNPLSPFENNGVEGARDASLRQQVAAEGGAVLRFRAATAQSAAAAAQSAAEATRLSEQLSAVRMEQQRKATQVDEWRSTAEAAAASAAASNAKVRALENELDGTRRALQEREFEAEKRGPSRLGGAAEERRQLRRSLASAQHRCELLHEQLDAERARSARCKESADAAAAAIEHAHATARAQVEAAARAQREAEAAASAAHADAAEAKESLVAARAEAARRVHAAEAEAESARARSAAMAKMAAEEAAALEARRARAAMVDAELMIKSTQRELAMAVSSARDKAEAYEKEVKQMVAAARKEAADAARAVMQVEMEQDAASKHLRVLAAEAKAAAAQERATVAVRAAEQRATTLVEKARAESHAELEAEKRRLHIAMAQERQDMSREVLEIATRLVASADGHARTDGRSNDGEANAGYGGPWGPSSAKALLSRSLQAATAAKASDVESAAATTQTPRHAAQEGPVERVAVLRAPAPSASSECLRCKEWAWRAASAAAAVDAAAVLIARAKEDGAGDYERLRVDLDGCRDDLERERRVHAAELAQLLESQKRELTVSRYELVAAHQELRSSRTELIASNAQVTDLEKRLRATEADLEGARGAVVAADGEVAAQRSALAAVVSEVKDAEGLQVQRERKTRARVLSQQAELQTVRSELLSAELAAESVVVSLKRRIEAAESEADTARAEVEAAQKAAAEAKAEVKTLQTEAAEAKAEACMAKEGSSEAAALARELTSVRESLRLREEQVGEVRRDLEMALAGMRTSGADAEAARRREAEARAEAQRVREEAEAARCASGGPQRGDAAAFVHLDGGGGGGGGSGGVATLGGEAERLRQQLSSAETARVDAETRLREVSAQLARRERGDERAVLELEALESAVEAVAARVPAAAKAIEAMRHAGSSDADALGAVDSSKAGMTTLQRVLAGANGLAEVPAQVDVRTDNALEKRASLQLEQHRQQVLEWWQRERASLRALLRESDEAAEAMRHELDRALRTAREASVACVEMEEAAVLAAREARRSAIDGARDAQPRLKNDAVEVRENTAVHRELQLALTAAKEAEEQLSILEEAAVLATREVAQRAAAVVVPSLGGADAAGGRLSPARDLELQRALSAAREAEEELSVLKEAAVLAVRKAAVNGVSQGQGCGAVRGGSYAQSRGGDAAFDEADAEAEAAMEVVEALRRELALALDDARRARMELEGARASMAEQEDAFEEQLREAEEKAEAASEAAAEAAAAREATLRQGLIDLQVELQQSEEARQREVAEARASASHPSRESHSLSERFSGRLSERSGSPAPRSSSAASTRADTLAKADSATSTQLLQVEGILDQLEGALLRKGAWKPRVQQPAKGLQAARVSRHELSEGSSPSRRRNGERADGAPGAWLASAWQRSVAAITGALQPQSSANNEAVSSLLAADVRQELRQELQQIDDLSSQGRSLVDQMQLQQRKVRSQIRTIEEAKAEAVAASSDRIRELVLQIEEIDVRMATHVRQVRENTWK